MVELRQAAIQNGERNQIGHFSVVSENRGSRDPLIPVKAHIRIVEKRSFASARVST
jgi:hypothetical protein